MKDPETKAEIDRMSTADRLRVYAKMGAMIRGWGPVEDYVPAFLARCEHRLPFSSSDSMEDMREHTHVLHTLGRWAQHGFNVFDLTPDLAAGLLLTDPPETEGELRLPFPCFFIRLPPEVIPLFLDGRQYWAEGIWCHRFSSRHGRLGEDTPFFRWTLERKSVSLWRDRIPTNLDDPNDHETYNKIWEGDPPIVPEDDISSSKALRLIKNFVSWLDATGGIESQPRPEPPHVKRQVSKEKLQEVSSGAWPHIWLFGKNVKLRHELRQAARDFSLVGTSHSPTGWKVSVRHTVRGHFKSQAYGEGGSLRKRKWIEPYYRGPEGAVAWAHVYADGTKSE